MASPEFERRVGQLRHDVDDVYELLDRTNTAVAAISSTQRRHGNRLEEIQSSVDLTVGRLDRLEQNQRAQGDKLDAILAALRGNQAPA